MSWTEEKVAKLKELWSKGHTASQIAEALGDTTRNAVIGKAHRLNLEARAPSKQSSQSSTSVNRPVRRGSAPISRKAKFQSILLDKNFEPEIKKVKKQETEKREYKIKDYVVYPKHGVGQITEFKKISIGGIDVETYVIKFEKDKANGMVPVNKQSHLRPLATINQINK